MAKYRAILWFSLGGGGMNVYTARLRNSMNLFEADRPIDLDMALDHDDVSSVVVLFILRSIV